MRAVPVAADAARRARLDRQKSLERTNVRRLLALRAGLHIELNALIFFQRLEAVGLNLGEMRKHVFAAIIGRDEAKAFSIVEPFYDTGFHSTNSLEIFNRRAAPSARNPASEGQHPSLSARGAVHWVIPALLL